jgi:hypothetical protein
MVVETGRRMLLSNLNLSALCETRSGSGQLYSRSAIEFFRVFPQAQTTFKVRTAVRMNASFPYISPAVSLPTDPPRRLVDAGYYDNYGVDLAAAWAYAHRDWILENTSGLALIQIHAYAVEKAKLATLVLNEPKPDSSSWFFDRLSRSFQWLTSPATAVVSSRQWSMAFRNDEQLRDLDDDLNGECPGMFRVFVFENPVDVAMNWFISRDDIDQMRARFKLESATTPQKQDQYQFDNLKELNKLIAWWNAPPPSDALDRNNGARRTRRRKDGLHVGSRLPNP